MSEPDFTVNRGDEPTVNLQEINERAQNLRDDGLEATEAWIQAFNEAIDALDND